MAHKKYKDWLFLFGTIIVSETVPKEFLKGKNDPKEKPEHLYYNFAPLYRGYDPDKTDHYGKRFLVPKRYVSNIDFLTPLRQFDDNNTKELLDSINRKREIPHTLVDDQESSTVHNPFELRRKYYDRDMWYTYKDELSSLGYTMVEYDWLILDNITLSVEVCLDHDASTALKAYLADTVLGSPTQIPQSVELYDPVLKRFKGSVEYVGIPRHQAQLSLVSSSGMTVNPKSLVLANNGTIILQDGMSSREGSMVFEMECDRFEWKFAGGSEHITRTAQLTSTEIDFAYHIQKGHRQVGIWDDLEDHADVSWKQAIRGVFTTERYEPKITVYAVRDIAKV